jgi:hypothetical protein
MAVRTPQQLATRRRIERGIALAAPFLDVVLAVGERVSRVAGRGQIEPEPPRRRLSAGARTPIGGEPDRS